VGHRSISWVAHTGAEARRRSNTARASSFPSHPRRRRPRRLRGSSAKRSQPDVEDRSAKTPFCRGTFVLGCPLRSRWNSRVMPSPACNTRPKQDSSTSSRRSRRAQAQARTARAPTPWRRCPVNTRPKLPTAFAQHADDHSIFPPGSLMAVHRPCSVKRAYRSIVGYAARIRLRKTRNRPTNAAPAVKGS